MKSKAWYLTVRNCPGRSEFIQPGLVRFGTREKLKEFSVETIQHVPKKLVGILHRVILEKGVENWCIPAADNLEILAQLSK